MASLVLAILFSLVASAFCSISEAAFYSFPRSSAEMLVRKGNKLGRYLLEIKTHMDETIAAVLILNTMANTFGVFWATRSAANYLTESQQWAIPWVMAILILLFGEITPKTIGVKQARTVTPILAVLFYYLIRLLRATGLITLSIRVTSRLTQGADSEYNPEDIQGLAELGVREGILDPQQAEIIRNILHLKNKTARSVMTPRQVVFSLHAQSTIQKSIDEHGQWSFSRVPLYGHDKDHWIGVVLRRDAYNELAENRQHTKLSKLLRPLEFVPDSISIETLLHRFLKQRGHLMGVVDEYGSLAGIVTLEDTLEALLGREIVDEFDQNIDLQEHARQHSIALAAIQSKDNEKPTDK